MDYMEAYLEFLKVNNDNFKKAREIVQKYEKSPDDSFGFK